MMGTLGFVTAIWQIVLIRMVAWMAGNAVKQGEIGKNPMRNWANSRYRVGRCRRFRPGESSFLSWTTESDVQPAPVPCNY
jgi:hypothetical protein